MRRAFVILLIAMVVAPGCFGGTDALEHRAISDYSDVVTERDIETIAEHSAVIKKEVRKDSSDILHLTFYPGEQDLPALVVALYHDREEGALILDKRKNRYEPLAYLGDVAWYKILEDQSELGFYSQTRDLVVEIIGFTEGAQGDHRTIISSDQMIEIAKLIEKRIQVI
ncbi:hypothetical protein ACFL4G_11875 [Thermodesulfobacteriota bacterium]